MQTFMFFQEHHSNENTNLNFLTEDVWILSELASPGLGNTVLCHLQNGRKLKQWAGQSNRRWKVSKGTGHGVLSVEEGTGMYYYIGRDT